MLSMLGEYQILSVVKKTIYRMMYSFTLFPHRHLAYLVVLATL